VAGSVCPFWAPGGSVSMNNGCTMKPRVISLPEALSREHQALLKHLHGLEQAVATPSREEPARMIPRLETLREHLTQHFRFEEENGYMDVVRRREPHREREINQLQEEHRELAQTLAALLAEAGKARHLHDTFAEKVRAWVKRIRHHESHENDLVLDTFNRDTSAED